MNLPFNIADGDGTGRHRNRLKEKKKNIYIFLQFSQKQIHQRNILWRIQISSNKFYIHSWKDLKPTSMSAHKKIQIGHVVVSLKPDGQSNFDRNFTSIRQQAAADVLRQMQVTRNCVSIFSCCWHVINKYIVHINTW